MSNGPMTTIDVSKITITPEQLKKALTAHLTKLKAVSGQKRGYLMSSDDADSDILRFEIYTLLMKSLLSSGFVKNHSELRYNAIVDELKRDYPSLYIECLTEGLISTETEGLDVI